MATDKPTHEDVDRAVRTEIARRITLGSGDSVVSDDQTLEALGLASLDVMELVDRLEPVLQVDPFESSFSLNDVRTVGDLCRAYYATLDGRQPDGQDDALIASRARAEARRGRTS